MGDTSTIADAVRKVSEEFERVHKDEGISVVYTHDSTLEINDSVKVLGGNMLMGIVLVVIILWMALGFRNAILTSVGIPFSILFFAVMINSFFSVILLIQLQYLLSS